VITQSFGATEQTFPGVSSGDDSSLLSLRYAYKDAYAHHVTGAASYRTPGWPSLVRPLARVSAWAWASSW
jgi:hypothetical protein